MEPIEMIMPIVKRGKVVERKPIILNDVINDFMKSEFDQTILVKVNPRLKVTLCRFHKGYLELSLKLIATMDVNEMINGIKREVVKYCLQIDEQSSEYEKCLKKYKLM